MEGRRFPLVKGAILQTVQGPTPSNATPTTATHDAKHNMGGSTQPNEQHAVKQPHESMAATGEQWVLTIRGEG